MSTPINDGGPAFPAPMFTRQADGQPMCPQEFGLGGMSLRHYFAGQALAGWTSSQCSIGGQPLDGSDEHAAKIAQTAYRYADAMLAVTTNEANKTK